MPILRPQPIPVARQTRVATGPGESLPKGEKAILTACAQYPGGADRTQLTILTGYKRSSRDAYLQRLREKGYVETSGDTVAATDAGVDALGADFEPLPTGDALREHWFSRLPEGERKILAVLIDRYPNAVARDELDEATGYKRSSRDAYLQRLSARKLVEAERGEVKASSLLF
jgi:DNA-binding MarR family transcriptional regulator